MAELTVNVADEYRCGKLFSTCEPKFVGNRGVGIFLINVFAIGLALPALLVPLGGERPDPCCIDPWLYFTFQCLYCLLSYPLIMMLTQLGMRSYASWQFLLLWIPLCGMALVCLLYYMLVLQNYGLQSYSTRSQIAPLGDILLNFVVWFFFLVLALEKSRENNSIVKISTVAIAKKETNTHPPVSCGGPYYEDCTTTKVEASNNRHDEEEENSDAKSMSESELVVRQSTPISGNDSCSLNPVENCNNESASQQQHQFVDNPMQRFKYAFTFSFLILVQYAWCMEYVNLFKEIKSRPGLMFGLYIVFVTLVQIGRCFILTIAQYIDRLLPSGDPCMYIVGDLMISSVYEIFYRNLFSFVDSWNDFIALTFASSVMEIVFYSFVISPFYIDACMALLQQKLKRKSKFFRPSTNRSFTGATTQNPMLVTGAASAFSTSTTNRNGFQDSYFSDLVPDLFSDGRRIALWRKLLAIMVPNMTREGLFLRNAFTISYRMIIKLTSIVSYIAYAVFIRYGYNKDYFTGVITSSDERTFLRLVYFNVISFLADVLIFAVTDNLFVRNQISTGRSVSILNRFYNFFFDPKNFVYLWFLVISMAHIMSDLMVAKIDYHKLKPS